MESPKCRAAMSHTGDRDGRDRRPIAGPDQVFLYAKSGKFFRCHTRRGSRNIRTIAVRPPSQDMKHNHLSAQGKLKLLQEIDPAARWASLDDARFCILCEKTLTGRRVRVHQERSGSFTLHCPTHGCAGTHEEWIRPGSPLLAEDVWKDWLRGIDDLGGSRRSHSRNRVASSARTHRVALMPMAD
jgi:hypothetical protein